MNEHHLRVARTARVVTIGSPGAHIRELWIACHGYGQLAPRFARPFEVLAAPERLIVLPEALNRYYLDPAPQQRGPDARVGATWMTREQREGEIADYVAYLDQVLTWAREPCEPARPQLTILGFSQGVATVLRWIAHGTARPGRLVLWAGALPDDVPSDLLAARLAGAEVLLVAGEGDPFTPPDRVRAWLQALRQALPQVQLLEHPGGHAVSADVLQRVVKRW